MSTFPFGVSFKFLSCGYYVLGTAVNMLVSRTFVVSLRLTVLM